MSADLLARARAGDGDAFGELVEPYRHELQVHCYRFLGSAQDAEDAVQETLLAAWRGLEGFEGRASVRTWLYRVATSRCLHTLRSARRRPPVSGPDVVLVEPTRMGEVAWLEPYPDVLLADLPDEAPGPLARYEAREAISLAFITALQLLPPQQRAVLILRDVLGFRTREAAEILQASEPSVASALKRARAALAQYLPPGRREAPPLPHSPAEQRLVDRLTQAFEAADVDGIVALLTDDAWVTMPPMPLEYQGRELALRFFTLVFRRGRRFRLVATRANGQPAFGVYERDRHTPVLHANGLIVLTLAGDRISMITRFDASVMSRFGLPRSLPG